MSEQTVQQLFDMTGQTALITGATGHLGQSLARALAEAGASVVTASRQLLRAQQAAEQLPGEGPHFGVELDHLDEDSLNTGFDAAVAAAGKIDVLVNNAGINFVKPFDQMTIEEWDRLFLVDLRGVFLCIRACIDDFPV